MNVEIKYYDDASNEYFTQNTVLTKTVNIFSILAYNNGLTSYDVIYDSALPKPTASIYNGNLNALETTKTGKIVLEAANGVILSPADNLQIQIVKGVNEISISGGIRNEGTISPTMLIVTANYYDSSNQIYKTENVYLTKSSNNQPVDILLNGRQSVNVNVTEMPAVTAVYSGRLTTPADIKKGRLNISISSQPDAKILSPASGISIAPNSQQTIEGGILSSPSINVPSMFGVEVKYYDEKNSLYKTELVNLAKTQEERLQSAYTAGVSSIEIIAAPVQSEFVVKSAVQIDNSVKLIWATDLSDNFNKYIQLSHKNHHKSKTFLHHFNLLYSSHVKTSCKAVKAVRTLGIIIRYSFIFIFKSLLILNIFLKNNQYIISFNSKLNCLKKALDKYL